MTEPTAISKDTLRKSLLAYRVTAWVTGIWLIALCYELVAHYVFGDATLSWIGIVHGWVYFAYLLCTFNLAVKVRWPLGQTIGTLLAGTIPLLGIVVEHVRTEDVRKRFDL